MAGQHHFIIGSKDGERLVGALSSMYEKAMRVRESAILLEIGHFTNATPDRLLSYEPCPVGIGDLPPGVKSVKGNCVECTEAEFLPLFAKTYGVDNPLAAPLPAKDNVVEVDFSSRS